MSNASGELALALAVLAFLIGRKVWVAIRPQSSPGKHSPEASASTSERGTGGHDPLAGDRGGAQERVATWLTANRDQQPPSALQRTAEQVHGVSESTVKRAWRKVRGAK